MAFVSVLFPASMRSSRRRPPSDPTPASARQAAGNLRRGDGRRNTNNTSGLSAGAGIISPRKRRQQRDLSKALDEAEALLATGAAGNAELGEVARIKRERDVLRGKARMVADSVLGDAHGGDVAVELVGGGDEALRREFELKEAALTREDLRHARKEDDEVDGEDDMRETGEAVDRKRDGAGENLISAQDSTRSEKSSTPNPTARPSPVSSSPPSSPSSAPSLPSPGVSAGSTDTPCEKCEGKGYLWICPACDAEGFVKAVTPAAAALKRFGAGGGGEGEVLWRTCEKCVGVGKMPCDVCQGPIFSETITPVPRNQS